MSLASPQTDTERLFNEFFGATTDDEAFWERRPAAAQALWRVRQLARKHPADFVTRVLLAALSLQVEGKEEALEAAHAAHTVRDRGIVPAQALLARVFATIGDFSTAVSLVKELTSTPELIAIEPTMNIAPHIAFIAGDAEYLQSLTEIDQGYKGIRIATLLQATLNEADLTGSIGGHNKTVWGCVENNINWFTVRVMSEEDWPPLIEVMIFLNADDTKINDLDRTVTESLVKFYRGEGKSPGSYLGYVSIELDGPGIGISEAAQ